MKGTRAWVGSILLFLSLQMALIGIYLAVEATRETPFLVEKLDYLAPPLHLEGRLGRVELATEGVVLVHFWATWCVPCRKELPGLLAAAHQANVPILAISDEPWPAIEAFFGGTLPEGVLRDPGGEGARAFQVSGFPDTFVVDTGRVVGRIGGARDWEQVGPRRFLRGFK